MAFFNINEVEFMFDSLKRLIDEIDSNREEITKRDTFDDEDLAWESGYDAASEDISEKLKEILLAVMDDMK